MDKEKIDVIEKLPPPMNVKEVRSFLGHAGFYRRFKKDFSKVSKPLSNLQVHDQRNLESTQKSKKEKKIV